MQISPVIFREYDIRGVADSDLSNPVVEAVGKAFGTWLRRRGVGKISVGGDVRLSTARIERAAVRGLTWAGIDVVRLGTVTTPMLYWSIPGLSLGGGVMITGSHNPKDMNGLKLACGTSTLYGDEIREILRMILDDDLQKGPAEGRVETADISGRYLEMLQSKISLGPRKLKVVADCGNGTAGLHVWPFLESIGCAVVSLFDKPDGTFPNHHPDPQKRENLLSLMEAVVREKADLGIAFDGDADRLGVVDERGEMIWGDILMALFWEEILPKHPGAEAIVEVKCSQSLVDEIRRLGGKPLFWKSGHSLIKAKMKEIGAVFAGEVSGHMFFADEFFGFDDSFYAAGRLLRLLSHSPEPLSALVASLPRYFSTAETRFPCPDDRKFAVVERVKEEALRDFDAVTVDGVRIIYPTGWGLLRASNTQPILVARAEGKTPEDLERNAKDLQARIERAGGGSFEWTY